MGPITLYLCDRCVRLFKSLWHTSWFFPRTDKEPMRDGPRSWSAPHLDCSRRRRCCDRLWRAILGSFKSFRILSCQKGGWGFPIMKGRTWHRFASFDRSSRRLRQEIEAHRRTTMRQNELHGLLIAERLQRKQLEEAVRVPWTPILSIWYGNFLANGSYNILFGW